ncbi:RING finger protein 112-like isoform X2 [Pyxicephalus adspersus]|uniref:RING finger protein 112-like isoform X2 n=1 Tax=Pyxicephalus adspersus TaxID=30357 RepID=UPI003B5B9975
MDSNIAICEQCTKEGQVYMSVPCGHMCCWPCMKEFQEALPGNNCPTCYYNQFFNSPGQPLQLIKNETGQLHLEDSAVQRCFSDCDDCQVYVISVIGERRTGKSFLMNYLMRALGNLEKKKNFSLGAENESLSGFPWRPGNEKVTEGIWIWGKPFILENNGHKLAVFLLDTEGSKSTKCHDIASIKLFVLTMMISSNIVYNVHADVKETDIDYLEIYCDKSGNDPFHLFGALKYFDVLVRDRPDEEDCEEDSAKTYITEQIQKLGKHDMEGVLNLVEEKSIRCFLMPNPGKIIAEGEKARLRDMLEDFQNKLKMYLFEVIERTQNSSSFLTCGKMAAKLKMCVEFVQNECYFSSPSELCNALKIHAEKRAEEEMERMKTEFQDILKNQKWWILPDKMSTVVSEKIQEIIKKFNEQSLLSRDEHRLELTVTLLKLLLDEGEKYCETHKKDLKIAGLKAAIHVGVGAAATAAIPFLLPAAAPAAAAGGFLAAIRGWFVAAPVAAAVPGYLYGAAAGAVGMMQVGTAYVLKKFW